MRRLTTLIVIAVVAVSLSACGRKGKPIPPEGATYPRQYPDIVFPPNQQQEQQNQGGTESQYR